MTDSRFRVLYGNIHIRTVSANTKQEAIDKVIKSMKGININHNKLVAYEYK